MMTILSYSPKYFVTHITLGVYTNDGGGPDHGCLVPGASGDDVVVLILKEVSARIPWPQVRVTVHVYPTHRILEAEQDGIMIIRDSEMGGEKVINKTQDGGVEMIQQLMEEDEMNTSLYTCFDRVATLSRCCDEEQ